MLRGARLQGERIYYFYKVIVKKHYFVVVKTIYPSIHARLLGYTLG
jgi:hypothetical protein